MADNVSAAIDPGDATLLHLVGTASGATGVDDWRGWEVATNGEDISSLAGVEDGDSAIQVMFVLTSDGLESPTVMSFSVTGVEIGD